MIRAVARELMDDPVESAEELEENLRDIERTNRWFGGIAPVVRTLREYVPQKILDVGSGSGDVALAIARALPAAHVTCLDRSEQMLSIARRRTGAPPSLAFVHGDGTALDFADDTFDAVVCTLALHHFEPAAAIVLLREMRRVARIVPLVCDLTRSNMAWLATSAFVAIGSRNRLTRHDAPLSVRRAYLPSEALDLAQDAGWRFPRVRREPWFRMTLVDAG